MTNPTLAESQMELANLISLHSLAHPQWQAGPLHQLRCVRAVLGISWTGCRWRAHRFLFCVESNRCKKFGPFFL